MTETNKYLDAEDKKELKPFGLVKFFSFTALVFFMVSTIVLVWFITNNTKKMLQNRSEAYALVLAENLNHQVYLQFVLPTIVRYGKIALRNKDQFERLDTIVRNTTHGLNMQSVTIFDRELGIASYSTIGQRVGKKGFAKEEYKRALTGDNNSTLIVDGSLLSLLPGNKDISCQLKTYIPFRQEERFSQRTGQIMGVFEIVQDLSDDYKELARLQGAIIGISVLIMSALFVGLWLVVARGDRIIAGRVIERRKLEEKLNHAERLAGLGKMVASVSHEIKNPLGIVRSTAEILEKRLKNVAPGNEHLASIIIEETSRLDRIVREFLDFARPQKLNMAAVSIAQILRKTIVHMQPELDQSKITISDKIEDNCPEIVADHERLYQVFLNIFVNAIQAMPEGGVLTVVVKEKSGPKAKLSISISDSGIGMSEPVIEQIFIPFFTNKIRGTGLGMAIVKNIIDFHGGKIWVDSKEGEGASFTMELPVNTG